MPGKATLAAFVGGVGAALLVGADVVSAIVAAAVSAGAVGVCIAAPWQRRESRLHRRVRTGQ